MGTTLRIIEYSIALSFVVSDALREFLQAFIGYPVWQSLPDWVGATALSIYVPVILANILVLRRPAVSRKNVWLFCITMKFVLLGFSITVLNPSAILSPGRDLWRAAKILLVWVTAAGFTHLFVSENGYRQIYKRFEETFRV